jgi:anaerobic glycerol-3-phosphate dehydrogenase
MTGGAIKEFHVLRDDLFDLARADQTVLLPATMCASYDALATTSRNQLDCSLCR